MVFVKKRFRITTETIGKMQIAFGLFFIAFAVVSFILIVSGLTNTMMMAASGITQTWHNSLNQTTMFAKPLIAGNVVSFLIEASTSIRAAYLIVMLLEAIILILGIMVTLAGMANLVKSRKR